MTCSAPSLAALMVSTTEALTQGGSNDCSLPIIKPSLNDSWFSRPLLSIKCRLVLHMFPYSSLHTLARKCSEDDYFTSWFSLMMGHKSYSNRFLCGSPVSKLLEWEIEFHIWFGNYLSEATIVNDQNEQHKIPKLSSLDKPVRRYWPVAFWMSWLCINNI